MSWVYLSDMSTLAERIALMVKETGLSQNALGRAVGIESGPMSRLANDQSEESERSAAHLVKLALEHGYSPVWLVLGRGEKRSFGNTEGSVPSAVGAVAAALSGIYDPEAIEAMRQEPHGPNASDPEHLKRRVRYFQTMRDEDKEAKRLRNRP